MAAETTVTGLVLSTMPIGEYDKRLVLLTRERGKITVFAKGARKPGSAFLACSQSFSFGEFSLFEGRSAYNLIAVNITNYFEELRKDLEGAYYGLYFCELADYFTRENDEGRWILLLLYQSLKALSLTSIKRVLIRLIFELKILVLDGEAPQVFECVKCREEKGPHYFSSKGGGLLCQNCKGYENDRILVSDSAVYTLQFIVTSSIQKLYTFTVTDEIMAELKKCVASYCSLYIDRKMKSAVLLEKLF